MVFIEEFIELIEEEMTDVSKEAKNYGAATNEYKESVHNLETLNSIYDRNVRREDERRQSEKELDLKIQEITWRHLENEEKIKNDAKVKRFEIVIGLVKIPVYAICVGGTTYLFYKLEAFGFNPREIMNGLKTVKLF